MYRLRGKGMRSHLEFEDNSPARVTCECEMTYCDEGSDSLFVLCIHKIMSIIIPLDMMMP
jgi:hypothetical protein